MLANNPYVNKVEINGVTKLDLTADTVAPELLLNGITAHDKSGAPITGTLISKSNQANKDYSVLQNGNFEITPDTGYDGMDAVSLSVNVPQGIPIDVSTASGMNAVLIAANVGKAYRYTGTTTSTYTNGDIYVVEG